MPMLRSSLALLALLVSVPASAAQQEGYTAKIKVTEGDDVVVSSMAYAEHGKPVLMRGSHSQRYGGKDGPIVETGFSFEMLPHLIGDTMHVEINLDRSEVTDSMTGAVTKEAAVLQGDATRVGDGWTYVTDKLPGGKVLRVTFQDAPRPEWDMPKAP